MLEVSCMKGCQTRGGYKNGAAEQAMSLVPVILVWQMFSCKTWRIKDCTSAPWFLSGLKADVVRSRECRLANQYMLSGIVHQKSTTRKEVNKTRIVIVQALGPLRSSFEPLVDLLADYFRLIELHSAFSSLGARPRLPLKRTTRVCNTTSEWTLMVEVTNIDFYYSSTIVL